MLTDAKPPVAFVDLRRQNGQNAAVRLGTLPAGSPGGIRQLALAADQFIVDRHLDGHAVGKTAIAGYPWFGDWGRDTMIALPGLALATQRYDVAAAILRTFAAHVSEGLLPNRFPDGGETPEYNTVDATLWFFHAIDQYSRYSGDPSLAAELYPVLVDIIAWHRRGTRYGIHVDAVDGLLAAGQDGVQLTWMDAKVGDRVVTPRIGKCVEINALWYNALRLMQGLASQLDEGPQTAGYRQAAELVEQSFERFWNPARGALYDLIDGPEGESGQDGQRYDARLRPNQILAVSLPHSPLDPARRAGLCGALWGRTARTRRRLSPGHRLDLADRSVRGCPLPRVWRCRAGPVIPRAAHPAPTGRLSGQHQRDLRRRAALRRARLFRPGLECRRVLRAWLSLQTHETPRPTHPEGIKHGK